MLSFIVAGLVSGSVYSLAGVGLVLTYKTSGILNFAHGALATASAFLFYTLWVQRGVPWPVAALICVGLAGLVMGLIMERLARAVVDGSLVDKVVATVGVLLVIQACVTLLYGTVVVRTVPQFLPDDPVNVFGAIVTTNQAITIAVGIAGTVALYAYMRVARGGISMRAVVEDPTLLDLSGTNPNRVRQKSWIVGAMFASVSGLLLVTSVTLDATTLTFLVIAAFGAAAVGMFRSLPATYIGGLAIGVASALCSRYFIDGFWSGLSATMPFIVLFVVLLISPKRRLAEPLRRTNAARDTWVTPPRLQVAALTTVLSILAIAPTFAGVHLADATLYLGYVVLFLSLGLLVRTSGQVSLCHVTFMAIGACVLGHLTADQGWPWVLALLTAGLVAVPVGALLSIPAIRLGGIYLALATFGFGILVQYLFYPQDYFFGTVGVGTVVARPELGWLGADSDRNYYYLCLIVAVVAAGIVVAVNRGRLGQLLGALSESPKGLAASGASINVPLTVVFCLSAFLAAVAGGLIAGSIGVVTSSSYLPIQSLLYFAMILIVPRSSPWGALIAAAGVALLPSFITDSNATTWLQVAFGLTAIVYAVAPTRFTRTPAPLQRVIDRAFPRTSPRASYQGATDDDAARGSAAEDTALHVVDLSVRFGGLVAVDGVTLEAPTGRITGLIGPNGAGKTTVFNACSGLVSPDAGAIALGDKDLVRLSASARARHGLGRSFQQPELFDGHTVRQNVLLGVVASKAGANPLHHLRSSRLARAAANRAVEQILHECDLQDLADRTVGSLSTGQRRLVELARCLGGPFQILLLDEPSSGLDKVETLKFGALLQRVVEERGIGILLVEHDMALVRAVCDYIYVLDFGELIFEGTATEVLGSPVVHAAYLGSEASLEPDESPLVKESHS